MAAAAGGGYAAAAASHHRHHTAAASAADMYTSAARLNPQYSSLFLQSTVRQGRSGLGKSAAADGWGAAAAAAGHAATSLDGYGSSHSHYSAMTGNYFCLANRKSCLFFFSLSSSFSPPSLLIPFLIPIFFFPFPFLRLLFLPLSFYIPSPSFPAAAQTDVPLNGRCLLKKKKKESLPSWDDFSLGEGRGRKPVTLSQTERQGVKKGQREEKKRKNKEANKKGVNETFMAGNRESMGMGGSWVRNIILL